VEGINQKFIDKAVLGKAELALFPEMAFSGFRVRAVAQIGMM